MYIQKDIFNFSYIVQIYSSISQMQMYICTKQILFLVLT